MTSAPSAAPTPTPALAPLLRPARDDDGDGDGDGYGDGDVVAFDVDLASEAEDVGEAVLEGLEVEAVENAPAGSIIGG